MPKVVVAILCISAGASLGAILRWVLGMGLNSLFPSIPPGTLLANYIGSFVVGFILTLFAYHTNTPAEVRLLLITGFAGGLSTFSSFAAEMLPLIQNGRYLTAALGIGVHVGGSIICVVLGCLLFAFLYKKFGL